MLSFRLKMLCSAILIMVLLVCMPMLASAADDNITVIVDGTEIEFDVSPIIVNQRTMVPMRAIFEFLGADVEWIPEENAVRATNKTLELYLQIGNMEMIVNGQSSTLDVAPFVMNDRTLVPLRAVSEAFSAIVGWEDSTSTVTINTPNEKYAKAYDQSLNEVFDAKHIRTAHGDVEYFEMEIIGNKVKVTCLTTDNRMKSFGVRINRGSTLVKTKDVKVIL